MKKVNQDKADKLEKFLTELLRTCGGKCQNCALENVCDYLDLVNLNINSNSRAT
ncbi:MAG: hypothetical protein ACRC1T_13155 [Clostridium chrysemydis]|uniref:hypothetical protein n=1 Tax=Clostridium chrysemydis TaxID=2665504 RepID=UPI003F3F0B48